MSMAYRNTSVDGKVFNRRAKIEDALNLLFFHYCGGLKPTGHWQPLPKIAECAPPSLDKEVFQFPVALNQDLYNLHISAVITSFIPSSTAAAATASNTSSSSSTSTSTSTSTYASSSSTNSSTPTTSTLHPELPLSDCLPLLRSTLHSNAYEPNSSEATIHFANALVANEAVGMTAPCIVDLLNLLKDSSAGEGFYQHFAEDSRSASIILKWFESAATTLRARGTFLPLLELLDIIPLNKLPEPIRRQLNAILHVITKNRSKYDGHVHALASALVKKSGDQPVAVEKALKKRRAIDQGNPRKKRKLIAV